MLKRIWWVAAMCILIGGVNTAYGDEILNGTFDDELNPWNGWSHSSNVTLCHDGECGVSSHDNNFVEVDYAGNLKQPPDQQVSSTLPEGDYKLTFFYRTLGDIDTGDARVSITTKDPENTESVTDYSFSAASDWQEAKVVFHSTGDVTWKIHFLVGATAVSVPKLFLDDVKLEPINETDRTTDLLLDPSFEHGVLGMLPVGWSPQVYAPQHSLSDFAAIGVDDDAQRVRTGNKSLKIDMAQQGYFVLKADPRYLKGDELYTFSFWAMSEENGTLLRVDAKGPFYGSKVFVLSSGWQRLEFVFKLLQEQLDNADDQRMEVLLSRAEQQGSTEPGGTIWIDDMEWKSLDLDSEVPRRNLLPNGSFESAANPSFPDFWGAYAYTVLVPFFHEVQQRCEHTPEFPGFPAQEGTYSHKIEFPGYPGSSDGYRTFSFFSIPTVTEDVGEESDYVFSAYLRKPDSGGSVTVRMQIDYTCVNNGPEEPCHGQYGSLIKDCVLDCDENCEWQPCVMEISPSVEPYVGINKCWVRDDKTFETRINASIGLNHEDLPTEDGTFWIDAVKFEKGTTASAYTEAPAYENLYTLGEPDLPTRDPVENPVPVPVRPENDYLDAYFQRSFYMNESEAILEAKIYGYDSDTGLQLHLSIPDMQNQDMRELLVAIPDPPNSRTASISVDLTEEELSNCPSGRCDYEATIELLDSEGEPIEEATQRDVLTKLEYQSYAVPTDRRSRTLLVDGQPFVPYFFGLGDAEEVVQRVPELIPQIVDAGFNGILARFTEEAISPTILPVIGQFLDQCLAQNLKVICWLKTKYFDAEDTTYRDYDVDILQRMITAFRTHQAVIGWKYADEWYDASGLLYTTCKVSDPYRPAYRNIGFTAIVGDTGEFTDIYSADFYPFGRPNPVYDISDLDLYAGTMLNNMELLDTGNRRMPMYIWYQSFGYDFGTRTNFREPTPGEQDAMLYLLRLYGFTGFCNFLYMPHAEECWDEMIQLGEEFKALEPALLATDPERHLQLIQPNVYASLIKYQARTLLFVVNSAPQGVDFEIPLVNDAWPEYVPGTQSAARIFPEGEVTIDEDVLSDTLAGYGRHVYLLGSEDLALIVTGTREDGSGLCNVFSYLDGQPALLGQFEGIPLWLEPRGETTVSVGDFGPTFGPGEHIVNAMPFARTEDYFIGLYRDKYGSLAGWSVYPAYHSETFDRVDAVAVTAGDTVGDGYDEFIYAQNDTIRHDYAIVIIDDQGTLTGFSPGYGNQNGLARTGISVAAGDIDLDGKDEIVVVNGPNDVSEVAVEVFRGNGTLLSHFLAWDSNDPLRANGGGTVAVGNLDDDPEAEILVVHGPADVYDTVAKIYDWDIGSGTPVLQRDFTVRDYGLNAGSVGYSAAIGDVDWGVDWFGEKEIILSELVDSDINPGLVDSRILIFSRDSEGEWYQADEFQAYDTTEENPTGGLYIGILNPW